MGRSPDELQKIWLSSLKHERRASPNTLRAYGDDVGRFLAFQRGHLGGEVTEQALKKLRPADIRAFIATRRGEGLGAGGVQRALAAIRGFYKFLAREGILENAAPRAVRTPRLKRGLPRPLSEGLRRDIARLRALFAEGVERFGGPFLAGSSFTSPSTARWNRPASDDGPCAIRMYPGIIFGRRRSKSRRVTR